MIYVRTDDDDTVRVECKGDINTIVPEVDALLHGLYEKDPRILIKIMEFKLNHQSITVTEDNEDDIWS